MSKQKDLIIYQLENGALELKADFETDTIWASQKDIANIFSIDRTVVNRHINNIFKDAELDESLVSANFAHTTKHGALDNKTQTREIKFYSLDIILAVGYRTNSTNSSKAIQFRKWATQTLKQHIIQGYTVNESKVENDPNFLIEVMSKIKVLAQKQINNNDTLELIKTFSYTWFSLQSYDEQKFPKTNTTNDISISVDNLYKDLAQLKIDLITKKEATALFAQEKTKASLESIVNNVFQNVFGQELYPSVEEKCAHLLYFIIKNHPFNDGNKRSGAFAFIWLLQKFEYNHRITPETLATLTILIAESQPKDKDKMIGMILLLLAGHTAYLK
ncbi:Fic/DOC family protein [Allofrancisella inopinata]|uniref:Fic/DOC family protein n=2 Tax=Allofrancisella inopinata TaxID=1085647 RepID=A0AAE6YIY0_9GAMM|nr:virulence protein RhuM/Fic/DOC family protein [Allofrancisella inopinata]QIV96820.1 Fic/DOC family protein [Allofrancisella inopinata]